MRLTVDRFHSDEDATLSRVLIDGVFFCFGLEDEYRETKKAAETRIPAGTYKIGVRDTGGFHNRYAKKFYYHRGMLHVQDVPGFEYILIHIGNTDEDTAGCLLVGDQAYAGKGEIKVGASTAAYKRLYQRVIESAINGVLTIEYQDNDR